MKKQLTVLFIVIVFLLFGLHYLLFIKLEFAKDDYILAFLLLIPAILFSAYAFTIIAFEPKESQDKMLEHLIKESLHEINLPISTIEANIKMLEKNLQDEKDQKRAKRIKEALERLKRLYKMLAYNIKKEILQIEKEKFRVDELVKNRVEFFKSLNRNLFILNLKPLTVKADKIGLEQAIDNIIENAMKYSKKGSPIEIGTEGSILYIKDNGIGIDENQLPLIFQRYYQSDSRYEGEGIGLSIVKRYCDRENIILKIESKKGLGTKVILNFKKKIAE